MRAAWIEYRDLGKVLAHEGPLPHDDQDRPAVGNRKPNALDLAEVRFEGVEPAATGRPSYHPSALLTHGL